jgi:hypothetical protein
MSVVLSCQLPSLVVDLKLAAGSFFYHAWRLDIDRRWLAKSCEA